MLGGGNQHALLHQARGVADPRDVGHVRRDLEIVEIDPAENDARIGWGRHKPQPALHGRMKPYALDFDGALNGGLVRHLGKLFIGTLECRMLLDYHPLFTIT